MTHTFLAKTGHEGIFQSLTKLLHIFGIIEVTEYPIFPMNLGFQKPHSITCHFQKEF